MEILKLSEISIEEAAVRAADVLREGGIILYPTDTIYGLGGDALSDEAVAHVRALKGRDEGKPLHALVRDLAIANEYAEVDVETTRLVHALPKGKVSFIAPKRAGLDTGIAHGIETFGFRIPDHAFCQALLSAFGGPITATSANTAGEDPQPTVPQILAQLGIGILGIDLIIDDGASESGLPSTIIDMSSGPHPVILREGAVAASDVWEVLSQSDSVHG